MSEFFLEIYSEEIPSRMQNLQIYNKFIDIFIKNLNEFGFTKKNQDLILLTSPIRIAFLVDLENEIKIPEKIIKGPKILSDDLIISGFMKKYNIQNKSELKINNEYFEYFKEETSIETNKILPEIIKKCFLEWQNVWPATMNWNDSKFEWIRPIKSICCLFNDKIVQFSIANIQSSNEINLHKFTENKKVKINNFSEYKKEIENSGIILNTKEKSFNERFSYIKQEVQKIIDPLNLVDIFDDIKYEIAGLCEIPTILLCEIDEKFLKLPKEIIISVMKNHQKYIPLLKKDGSISKYFFVVVDRKIDSNEEKESIKKGNLIVINARLRDAIYFYEKDLETNIKILENKLTKLVFHNKLGSVFERIQKIKNIARKLLINIPDYSKIEKYIEIMKFDLVTEMVGEFAELQGIIGSYYAKRWINSIDEDLENGLRYQYFPNLDKLSDLSSILPASNNLEYAISLILVDEIPTSSKDPFAISRAIENFTKIGLKFKMNPFNLSDLTEVNDYGKTIILKEINKNLKQNFNYYEKLKKFDVDLNLYSKINKIISQNEKIFAKISILNQRISSFLKIGASINFEISIENKLVNILNICKKENDFTSFEENLKYFNEIIELTNEFIDNNMILCEDEILKNQNLAILKFVSTILIF